ncbi:MAG: AAA family ATPase [Gemmatimonadetes bacterium]|nr:AAA family ATPase [Gemmatimonadota bacterium]
MRNRLDKITLKGFKSIQSLVDFEPRPLNVLIGPNGASKSNLISFFRMLSWSLSGPDKLSEYVGRQGGASKLLHDGQDRTREIETELTIQSETGKSQYGFRLVFVAGDAFMYADERYRYSSRDLPAQATWKPTEPESGHRGPQLLTWANTDTTARVIRDILNKIKVFQFHNTSDTARIRNTWNVNDNRWLKEDAGNIAPVLLRLKEDDGRCYQRIVDTMRLILPFFSDFELEPRYESLLLQWSERDTDQVFSVSQASDGMLRVVALVTLLLLPERDQPDVLILDEPELGLHPYAINVVAGLINALSHKIQVIVATQSMPLIDCFEPSDIVVVNRENRNTTFKRLSEDDLEEWLENYSLSELWEKNVLGGRP